jgi:hypothetical protein
MEDDEAIFDVGSESSSITAQDELAGDCPTLKIVVAQQLKLEDGKPACFANIQSLRDELLVQLKESQCFILHFGVTAEFEAMVEYLALMKKNAKINVSVFRNDGKNASLDKMAPVIRSGGSVMCNILSAADYEKLSNALVLTVSEKSQVSLSQIKMIVILDETPGETLSNLIQSASDDATFFIVPGIKGSASTPITKDYIPQIKPTMETFPNSLCREWESAMIAHPFRNIKFPSIYLGEEDKPSVILDCLGLYVSMHPFGKTKLYAITVLESKGELVRDLLEGWVNMILGTPEKFIRGH